MKSAGIGPRDQTWRHRRRNWVRSFEHGLSKILGVNWWEVANLGRSSWKKGNTNLSTKLYDVGEDPGCLGRRPFFRIWARSWIWVSSENENHLNSLVSC